MILDAIVHTITKQHPPKEIWQEDGSVRLVYELELREGRETRAVRDIHLWYNETKLTISAQAGRTNTIVIDLTAPDQLEKLEQYITNYLTNPHNRFISPPNI